MAEVPSPVFSSASSSSNTCSSNRNTPLNNSVTPTNSMTKRTPIRNPYASSVKKKPKLLPTAKDGDEDIKVLSPPPRQNSQQVQQLQQQQQQQQQQQTNQSKNNEEEEDCVMEWSNATNANIDLPHLRYDCGVYSFAEDKLRFCDKCYCAACDKPVSACTEWTKHCQETKQKRQQQVIDIEDSSPPEARRATAATTIAASSIINPAVQSYYARMNMTTIMMNNDEEDDYDQDGYYSIAQLLAGNVTTSMGGDIKRYDNHYSEEFNQRYNDKNGRRRNPKDMRITEVLAEKMADALQVSDGSVPSTLVYNSRDSKDENKASHDKKAATSSRLLQRKNRFEKSKMDGDIAQLGLHKSFFVEGVRIGWPYPSILSPQRQMALHLIKALKNKRHAVLESPTGTGKSAAILCSVLAWQRFHARSSWGKSVDEYTSRLSASGISGNDDDEEKEPFPRIIYCSRTHSQVAQMVASLKKTPYRPRMTVLGSRDRLCIHSEIVDRNPSSQSDTANKKKANANTACRMRVANTEKLRRSLWKAHDYRYDDDRPPETLPGDGNGNQGQSQDPEEEEEEEEGHGSEWILKHSTKKLTCPHYRQLTAKRTAKMTRSNFILTQDSINCCETGGEKTSLGVHDIEDLVAFGVNPYKISGITLYRRNPESTSFGLDVGSDCRIRDIEKESAAESNGRLRKGDLIQEVNGQKVNTAAEITAEISRTSTDPLLLTILRNTKTRSTKFASFKTADSPIGGMAHSAPNEVNVSLIRSAGQTSWGMTLEGQNDHGSDCFINGIKEGGPAVGLLRPGDKIIKINGESVEHLKFEQIIHEIQKTKEDPLHVGVYRRPSFTAENTGIPDNDQKAPAENGPNDDDDDDDDVYSPHSACPYYLSKELSKHADLLFAPYNYVLDPGIRSALGIDLKGSVVVLDEAHNVEGVLTESGSLKVGEIELSKLVAMLSKHASAMRQRGNSIDLPDGTQKDLSEVAHDLLLFVEKIVLHMQGLRLAFERSASKISASKAIEDYLKYKSPDNTEYEVSYDGPSGHGVRKQAVGCKPFFDKLQISEHEINQLLICAQAMESHLTGSDSDQSAEMTEDQGKNSMFDLLNSLISKFSLAQESPEHFYVSCVIQANGNLDFAACLETDDSRSRFKKKPSNWPFVYPRSEHNSHAALCPCNHAKCKGGAGGSSNPLPGTLDQYFGSHGVRHGHWCDATITPRWEAHLVLKLLFPGLIMKDLASCRTLVLASGSLSPLRSLCAELDLRGENELTSPGKLQTKPPPLEANHVINKEKQLLAVAIGNFPDGTPLTVNYNNYRHPEFFGRLGDAIASVIECIPQGGVLVFLPSYSMLNKCVKCWNPFQNNNNRYGRRHFSNVENSCPEIWQRFMDSKGKVIVEPSGGDQAKFESARDEYAETIKNEGSCILLAVFRGKMSEGISFNDDNARGVICVGIPFPQAKERSILAKKAYNEEQRRLRGKTDLLPGSEWYSQEAFRAIAQALGRCIRHEGDYGTVVLLDSRHCDDGSPGFVHSKLPKWMRNSIRTLSTKNYGVGTNPICGGYPGLRHEMTQFFAQAPAYVAGVLEKRQKDFAAAQERDLQSADHKFNSTTGNWTPNIKGGGVDGVKKITQE